VDQAEFVRVETQIREAEEMDAKTHAAAELFAARNKLEKAVTANEAGDSKEAMRLLQEAELHAELAEARSLTRVQALSLEQINDGLNTLRDQLQ